MTRLTPEDEKRIRDGLVVAIKYSGSFVHEHAANTTLLLAEIDALRAEIATVKQIAIDEFNNLCREKNAAIERVTAECSCGWTGSVEVPEKQANRELAQHYSEVKHAG